MKLLKYVPSAIIGLLIGPLAVAIAHEDGWGWALAVSAVLLVAWVVAWVVAWAGLKVWLDTRRERRGHRYLSTACLHAVADDRPELHGYCSAMVGYQGEKRPGQCKWCDAHCSCPVCHDQTPGGSR